jgi:hypothetical protein
MWVRRIVFYGVLWAAAVLALAGGCADATEKPWGRERPLALPGKTAQVWAVAPAINLSGVEGIDPLLQSDLLYAQLQTVKGVTAIPVNRVAEVFLALKIERVQSLEQAQLVCQLLGADALVVPTITAYDPYNPPKFGGSLQLFQTAGAMPAGFDPRELSRRARPGANEGLARDPGFVQAVGMFDASNGTTRDRLVQFTHGRHDPMGPMGRREYLLSMDRYAGFAYASLIEDLLAKLQR